MEQVLRKRRRKRWFFAVTGVSLVMLTLYGYYWMKINVPSEMKLLLGQEENFDFSVPIDEYHSGPFKMICAIFA